MIYSFYHIETETFQAVLEAALKLHCDRTGLTSREDARREIFDIVRLAYSAGHRYADIQERSGHIDHDVSELHADLMSGCEICMGLVEESEIGWHSPLAIEHKAHMLVKSEEPSGFKDRNYGKLV